MSGSTDEQAKHQTSIANQQDQIAKLCEKNDFELIETYVEPGVSETDDNRP